MKKVEEAEEVKDLEETPQDDVSMKITIVLHKSQELSIQVSGENPEVAADYYKVIGLLEIAKNDLMDQQNAEVENHLMNELVSVTITEDDFKLDKTGKLKKSGKKPGDIIQMPRGVAQLREQAILQMKATADA